jgi:diguanylate cyclase (GGDEF)-like protein/PAS domain S-box-containing protein
MHGNREDPIDSARAAHEMSTSSSGHSEQLFKTAFDGAPIGMALLDLDGTYLEVNRSLCTITRYDRDELLGRNLHEMTHSDDQLAGRESARRVAEGQQNAYSREQRFVHADGGVVWVRVNASVARDAEGRPRHLICQVEDITERKEAEERLLHQALHDPLTGLHNRILFMDRLTHALARSERFGSPVAVLFVDLDHFKTINDEFGHRAGDEMLVKVARKLEGAVRPADTVARIGGDEFAVLCEDMKAEKDAVSVAERLCNELNKPVGLKEGTASITASIGIAFAQEGDHPDSLLKNADAAMYKVKEGGRGSYEIFLDAL